MSLISFLHRVKKKISFLIIGLMGLMIINKVIFLHSHVMKDGTVVTHAHPYKSASDSKPLNSHQHTKAAFCFFDHFQLLFLSTLFTLILSQSSIREKVLFPALSGYTQIDRSAGRNKAPPLFILM